MLLLQSLKEKVNSIFDFYLQFQRRKFWALLGTIILIAICIAICVLIFSFLIKSATNSSYDPMEYFLYGGQFDALFNSTQTIIFITLFTYSLAPTYFFDVQKAKDTPLFATRLREVSSKKIGYYFTFILIIVLLDLVPSPIRYNDMFAYYTEYNSSSFAIFFYQWFKLLTYLLGLIFCYILINKEKLDFNVLYKERKIITVSILVFLLLSLIETAVHSTVESYIGSAASRTIPVSFILSIIILCTKIAFSTLIVPAHIISLSSDKVAIRQASKTNSRSRSDDVIDEFEEIY